jgi:general secretion pathway protein F
MPAAAPAQIVKTRRGTDAANTFLFSQLAALLRAGINPAEAFTSLANRPIKPYYEPFLREAAKATTEGVRFGAVMEKYPYLFAPHIPGMIRAGEEGGYLVEACEQVATQTEESRKFNFWLWVFFWWVASNVVFIPPIFMMEKALDHLTDSFLGPNANSTTGTGFDVLRAGMTQGLLWPVGPVTLLLCAAYWWGYAWWMKPKQRPLRHRVLLRLPTIGRRARAESLAVFAWTLSMVSRVGIAPRTAWALATNAMPNVWLAGQMRKVGDQMNDGTKLSEALTQTGSIPSEYVPMVQTGELVGEVSSSLLTISNASYEESQRQAGMSKIRMGCWAMILVALSFLAGGIMISHFYTHMISVTVGPGAE